MPPSAHLVIVDAMNLIRRHYAVHQGQPDAIERLIQQTCRQITEILSQHQATHGVAVFDGDEPGWRHQLWPAYKSSRSPLPQELASQLTRIQDEWLALGLDSVIPKDDEADDVIATLAHKASGHEVRVTIVSTDQGFYQLLSENVHQYDAFGRQALTPEHYQAKFSIEGSQWPTYKALIGDTSSDIPGISGFGPKTAQEFIYHQLDEQILSPAKLKAWQQQKQEFALFKTLMTLERERLLDFKLSDLRWTECPLTLLVTGANRGLGLEFCRQYLADDHKVIACCRNPEQAEELQRLSLNYPDTLSLVTLDIADENQHHELRQYLTQTPVDILINNAGVYGTKGTGLEQIESDEWSWVMKVNAISPILLTRNLLFALKPDAKVIFISSKMASMGDNQSGGSYVYRSSKAALNAAAKSLALDGQERGLKVAILHPGWVQTDMGGPNALISVEQSITGMRSVIAQLDSDDSGEFINYDGQPIPW